MNPSVAPFYGLCDGEHPARFSDIHSSSCSDLYQTLLFLDFRFWWRRRRFGDVHASSAEDLLSYGKHACLPLSGSVAPQNCVFRAIVSSRSGRL